MFIECNICNGNVVLNRHGQYGEASICCDGGEWSCDECGTTLEEHEEHYGEMEEDTHYCGQCLEDMGDDDE